MVQIRSSPSSFCPLVIATEETVPALGAWTIISIFMAERTAIGWPFSTLSPSFTLIAVKKMMYC